MSETWTPKLPPSKPPIARQHCRHYDYVLGMRPGNGPKCAAGVDNTAPGATRPCMPDPCTPCAKREDWSEVERETWKAWSAEHRQRLLVVLAAIPDGYGPGEIPCPGCGSGTVRWGRASSNKHLHAACTTPDCFGVIQ